MTTVRVVHDHQPIGASLCLTWLPARNQKSPRLCTRPKGHDGGHLPCGPIPRTDITDSNPRWEKTA